MSSPETRNSDPRETNPQKKEDKKIQPTKPGSNPDQTPEREVDNPPVAEPEKGRTNKPGKIGF